MKYKPRPLTIVILLVCFLLLLNMLVQDVLQKLIYPQKYDEIIEKYAVMYDLPVAFVYAVVKAESDFDSTAVSSAGAVGLMQIMPSTFKWLTERTGEGLPTWRLRDPEVNIRYGCYYLRYLYDIFEDKTLTLAAYNAGIGNVEKWLASEEYSKDGRLTNIPFEETKNYINRVLRFEETYETLYPEKGLTT